MVKKFNWNKWARKTHYWGSFIVLLPVLIIIVTGIFLQLKKDVVWIQPETTTGQISNDPVISFEQILDIAKTIKEAEILEQIACEKNVCLQIGHLERFNPVFVEFKQLIDKPKYICH